MIYLDDHSHQMHRWRRCRLSSGIHFFVLIFLAGSSVFQSVLADPPPLRIYEIVEPNAVGPDAIWEENDAGGKEWIIRNSARDQSPQRQVQRGWRDVERGGKSKVVPRQFMDEVFRNSGGKERCLPGTGSEVVQCFQGSERRLRSTKVSKRDAGSARPRPCDMTAINISHPDRFVRDVNLPTSECR